MATHFRLNSASSILSFGLGLCGLTVHGQGLVNENAKITISPSTVIVVDNGGFTNNGVGGQLVNAGTIELDGNWVNNSATNVFGATPTATSGGTIILDGGAQSIGGTTKTHFWNLNAAGSAPNTKTLQVDANVFNVLSLPADRNVDLNTNVLTLESNAPAAITGAGRLIAETPPASGYGILSWNIGNTVNNYTIPFATAAGNAISVNYNVVNAGTGTASAYKRFSTYPTAVNNTPWATDVTHITDDYGTDNSAKVYDRFWVIDNDAQGNYTTYPNINLSFGYLDSEISGTITEANLVAQRFNDIDERWGDWLYSPVANTGANTVTVNLTRVEDYFPIWTLVDNSDPLPIELARFVGQCTNDGVLVSWTTYSEINNDLFTLERSKNGVDFEVVEVIGGAGNSNQPITYQVVDANSYGGTSYYRLKTTDYNGKEEYSQVVAVSCGTETTDFSLVNAYEIDNTDVLVEFTASSNEPYTVTLFDASGRLILNVANKAFEGMNKVRIPVGDIAHGIYIINLQNESKRFSRKVVLK